MTALSDISRRKLARPQSRGDRGSGVLARVLRFVGGVLRGLSAGAMLVVLVAGLPWALGHFIGWPLPDHVPTGDEIQAVVLSPMTTAFLLDVLACLCWIAWVAFLVDVVRCAVDAARGTRWPELRSGGPVHTVAAVLVGVIVLSLAGTRNIGQAPTKPSLMASHGPVAGTVVSWRPTPAVEGADYRVANLAVPLLEKASESSSVVSIAGTSKTVVREPRNGVHDSMWRIAERELGDGARWPEIFALNEGKPQPNGGQLINPNLIFPGEELLLPTGESSQPPPAAQPEPPSTSPPPPGPPSPPTATPQAPIAPGTRPSITDSHRHGSSPGVGWDQGIFVGLGLAAAVSTALLIARRRYRRSYRPGSGRRDDLPVAPVVSGLRLAHLRASVEPDDEAGPAITIPPTLIVGSSQRPEPAAPQAVAELGVRDGREIALDLAVARGLGVVGPGAAAAARALLVALLGRASSRPDPRVNAAVLVPAGDLVTLIGAQDPSAIPAALRVVTDLDAALDELDAEITVRLRDHQSDERPTLAVVASPPAGSGRRLQAILDNGAPLGIVGVLLGQWRAGVTAHVRRDGTVSATNPGVGEALEGTQLYRLPEPDTRDLLHLLRQAQPDTTTDQPATYASPTLPTTATPTADVPEPDNQHSDNAAADSPDTELEITRSHPMPSGTAAEDAAPAANLAALHLSGPIEQDPADDPPSTPVMVRVLGPLQIQWRADSSEPDGPSRDITAMFPPKQRELLVFLALHPHGVHRDAIAATLWADNPPERPTNALNTALSRLRRAMSTATTGALSDITVQREGRYQLNPAVVDVDYWHFASAIATRRAATTDAERTSALRKVVDGYTGRLADGMDTEWVDAVREATARDAIDAVAALARAMVGIDPEYTLNLLETARGFDPHNELLYRDIMRLQERLGRLDAIPRTLTLLTTRLAEIDEKPTPEALHLASRLQHRHDSAITVERRPSRDDRRGTAAAS